MGKKIKECSRCRGTKRVVIDLLIHNMGQADTAIISCPQCGGKGFITDKDRQRYLHSFGLAPCPFGN